MRVAFDASATRGRKTGIGVYTDGLMNALREFAPQVEIVELQDNARVEQRTDQRILREQFLLPRLAQEQNADVLHLTGFAAPLRSRVHVVLTVMDLIGVLYSQNFPLASRFYWSRYLPYTLRAAKQIVTLSENTKRDVMRLTHISAERINVVPPGIDARFQRIYDSTILQETAARLNLPTRYFLFVSTLEPRKGIDTLLKAFSLIVPHVPEHLVIVGKRGWYFETLFAQVNKSGLQEHIHFADYVSDQDLPAMYNLATAFVFPSRYEGFGLTPLEAMACGTPVISSNAASLPEIIGDAGISLEPNDVTGFAKAMRDFAANEAQRAEYSARGIQRAKLFSWKRAAGEMEKIYQKAFDARNI